MPEMNEQILEVRYKPNPKILDYRGSWAEAISDHMALPEWRIVENRIDILDKEDGDHAFVGFRNAGFVAHNTPTRNYFSDKTLKFFKYLFTLTGFEKNPNVVRIGVLSKFCTEFKGDFNELKEKYTSNYLTLTDKAKKMFNAQLIDIGGPLNFADKFGNFNTMSGPMTEEQIRQFFEKAENFPAVGLYFQIDYWIKPNREVNEKEILKHIKQFADASWDRFEAINKLILGE
jgi:hypothetical protein